ncbi:MAG: dihydroorotase [Hymenobacteraceae bacterium]|nr:dihydroorotase [Hymenobacteraceae bacterium]MDX5395818.1 dihydroorotase [Hymenobacteraceae bacterium]MDX5442735.1 dihydroorotase [Hymenobacteraceae bacterium]MDX5511873.1 dihydroorotase [Hymenobacteraceae bacterium]
MKSILIKNAQLVNEGKISTADVLVQNGRIAKIGQNITETADTTIDATGKYLLPGVIDDQVHFREPGLTHKAVIETEARAAVAGGTTSFMEMPNTVPNTLTQELLEDKYEIAAATSLANYSFYMGASNDNLAEVLLTNPNTVCGIKIFMGSSTGNMLVDNEETLEQIFEKARLPIAVHCEDEQTIRDNMAVYEEKYGDDIPVKCHPEIRNVAACFKSSYMAVKLAQKHNTRLHILHISTEEELELFRNDIPLSEKRITAEVCVHHLWFDKNDYNTLGSQIKCNPAIKEARHKKALLQGLLEDKLDVIATDHAPHTWEEKNAGSYKKTPSGVPLVQHSLQMMLEFVKEGKLTLEKMVEKMSHAPAILFNIRERGYIREGYWADLVLVDPAKPYTVSKDNIYYKCNWSPFEGKTFSHSITHTLVSGHLAFADGKFDETKKGERMLFDR